MIVGLLGRSRKLVLPFAPDMESMPKASVYLCLLLQASYSRPLDGRVAQLPSISDVKGPFGLIPAFIS